MTEIIIPDSVYSGLLGDASDISKGNTIVQKSLVDQQKEKEETKQEEKKVVIPNNIKNNIVIPQTVYDSLLGPKDNGSFSKEILISDEDNLEVGGTNGFHRYEKLFTSGFKYRASDTWYSLFATPASWFLSDEQQLLAKADIRGEMTDEEVEETLKDGFYQYYNKQVDARTEAQKRILDDLGMMPQGFGEKLAFSAGSLPVDLVRYLPAIALTRNPAYALALTDAYFASEEGPVEAAKAGAKGFIIGKTLQWAGPLAWHQRVPIGAGMGYVLTPGELEDRLVGATLFGGMSLLPTGRKNANTIIREVEKNKASRKEIVRTLKERVQGDKPKDTKQANFLIDAIKRDVTEGTSQVDKSYKLANKFVVELNTAKSELAKLKKDKSKKIPAAEKGLRKFIDEDAINTAEQRVASIESKIAAHGKQTLDETQFLYNRKEDGRVADKYKEESLDTRPTIEAKTDAFDLVPGTNIMKPRHKDIADPEIFRTVGGFFRSLFPPSLYDKSNPILNWAHTQKQLMYEAVERNTKNLLDDPVSIVFSNPKYKFRPTFVAFEKANPTRIKKTFVGKYQEKDGKTTKVIDDDGGAKSYVSKLADKDKFGIRRSEDLLYADKAIVPLAKALEDVAGPKGMYFQFNKLDIKSQDKVRDVMAVRVERDYMNFLNFKEILMNPKKFNQLSDKQINKYNQRYKRLKPLFDEKTGEVKTTALKDFYKLNEAEIGAYVQIRAGFDTAFKYLNKQLAIFDPNSKPIEKLPNFYPHRFLDNFVVKVENKKGVLEITEPFSTAKSAREAVKKYNDPSSTWAKQGYKARYEANDRIYNAKDSNIQVHAEALMHHKKLQSLAPELRDELYSIRSAGLLAAPTRTTRRRRLDFVKGYFGSRDGIKGVKDFVFTGKTYVSGTFHRAGMVEFNAKMKDFLDPITDAKIFASLKESGKNEKGLISLAKFYPNTVRAIRYMREDMGGAITPTFLDNLSVLAARALVGAKDITTFPVRRAFKDDRVFVSEVTRKQVDDFFGGTNFFIAFTRLFSWNARFIASQGIQPTQMIVPKLVSLREKTGGRVDPYRAWADSLTEMFYVTPSTMKFLQAMQDKGVVNNKFMREFMNEAIFQRAETPALGRKQYLDRIKNGDYYGVLARVGYKLSGLNVTGRTEQISRLQAALMFRSLYRQLGVKSEKKINDNAGNFADIYMVRYHYFDRASIFGHRGLGALAGKPVGLFKTFQQNYIAQLMEHGRNAVKNGEVKGFGAFLLSGLFTAGVNGIVGVQAVDSMIGLWNRLFQDDAPNLSTILYQAGVSDLFLYGVPSNLIQADLTSTLSAPSLSPGSVFSIPGYQIMTKAAFDALPNFLKYASPFTDIKPTREEMRDSIKLFMPTPFHAALDIAFQKDNAMYITKDRATVKRDVHDYFNKFLSMYSLDEARFIKTSYLLQQQKRNTSYSYDALVDYVVSELYHRGPDTAFVNYHFDMAKDDFGKTATQFASSIKTRLKARGDSLVDKLARGGFTENEKEEIKLFLQFSKASDLGFETKDSTPPLNMFKGDEHLFD